MSSNVRPEEGGCVFMSVSITFSPSPANRYSNVKYIMGRKTAAVGIQPPSYYRTDEEKIDVRRRGLRAVTSELDAGRKWKRSVQILIAAVKAIGFRKTNK
ncbi:hypothetical protein EYF80_035485 [Liparis tanakae]|uniref:Uncharacterized protein n=1 Tax=Liparis tanakae TaxID=230148 RepID=A0A4Z2GMA1_9TELE|nr:hypothetical protein EYF80_035485 [Liparis tanakae]